MTSGHQWRHRSGQSQNARLFGLGDIGKKNLYVELKESQWIGVGAEGFVSSRRIFRYCNLTYLGQSVTLTLGEPRSKLPSDVSGS